MQPPRYPTDALREAMEARVLLHVEYGDDGKVTSVKVEEAKGIDSAGKVGGRTLGSFRKVAEEAVRHWTFDNEVVDGKPMAGSGRVPILFCLSNACQNNAEKEPEMARDGELVAIDPA